MKASKREFSFSDQPEPHVSRTREIIQKHPEIKELFGRNPYSFLIILFIVSLQIFLAYFLSDKAWYWALIVAYAVGAFANHALFVMIHDCTHNLVFKKKNWNQAAAILCDLTNGLPTAISFRKYHIKHHAHQGSYELDADLASTWEAKFIGNSTIGKAMWLLFFPIFQAMRPPRLNIKFMNTWTWVNMVTVILFDVFIVLAFGPIGMLYIFASLFFSVGLHPLGARWIQEHYLVSPPQETYSYYGPLNLVAFNVGYHNEHHDFMSVPWNRLPKIKEMAPEYYDNLVYHTSWTKLFFKFLFDPKLSLYSRMMRDDPKAGVKKQTNKQKATSVA